MSADSKTTMMTYQDVIESLCELTASIQDLCNTINSEYSNIQPNKFRGGLKVKDVISTTLDEQISKGQPEKIMDWKKVELTPIREIEMENTQYAQKYNDFWKDIDESTQLEKETAGHAYTSAFSRFEEIYRLLGWRDADDEDPMFDKHVLTESGDLLMESIFGIEAYQMSYFREFSEKSRALFELSRLPRLLIILVRIACRQIYAVGACGPKKIIKKRPFDALTVVHVLAIVARTLKGFNLTSLSMERLLHQCYARRVLNQPGIGDVDTYDKQFELIYDCITALDFSRKFREIREPLCALFYMRYKSDSIQMLFKRIKTYEEATVGINRYPELNLEENMDSIFHPDIFAIPYLQKFGQLNIEWTDCLDEHLKIYANRNSIRIFAHPTFFYNGIDLHQDERDFMEPTYLELSLTYALLFRPISSANIRRLGQYVTAGEYQKIPWNNSVAFNSRLIHWFTPPWDKEVTNNLKLLSINPLKSPTKEILSESFYRCSLPPSTQVAFDIANPSRSVKGIMKRWDQHKVTSTSMKHILELAPNYPEDVKFMISSVMENKFVDMESFVRFPYFAPRLRRLKTYLDSRQPRTIRQLWYDRRDYRSWCMFWVAGFLCSCVLLCMLVILFVQITTLF